MAPKAPTTIPSGEVTQLLEAWQDGNDAALDQLLPLVYEELRRLASRYLKKERHGHTLQPTALVHEAYVRLLGQKRAKFENRSHFFAVASKAMRRVLVDHARRYQAGKRISVQDKVPLGEAAELATRPDAEILAVHKALERLSEIHPRQGQLVELRYFGGLTNVEAAEFFGISRATVERDWKVARIWLHRRLSEDG
ncbi:MAG: sigma-70 family RNA polymerase sigma factor [Thermoanaerobaculia bacterium]